MFKDAWIDCVKISTFVNAFKQSGICPLNRHAINPTKLLPSLPFSDKASSALPKVNPPQAEALSSIEKVMKPETLQVYNERYEESYDLDLDELYVVWSKLKQLSLTDKPTSATMPNSKNKEQNPFAILPEKQQKVSSVFKEVLTYPEPTINQKKPSKQCKGTSGMPKHLSSDQVIAYLEQKKTDKQREEDEKFKRKQEREEKKKEREEAKMKKQLEREKKKAEGSVQGGRGRGQRRGRGRGRGAGREATKQRSGQRDLEPSSSSDSDSPGESLNNSRNEYECPVCGLPEYGVDPWIACDTCNR